MKTNCVQVRRSIRPSRTVFCLGADMKNYTACEQWMDHSIHPRLCEYLFELKNTLLTVPRAVGPLAGISILLQLETKESRGCLQLTRRILTTMRLIHERTGIVSWVISPFNPSTRPTKEIQVIINTYVQILVELSSRRKRGQQLTITIHHCR